MNESINAEDAIRLFSESNLKYSDIGLYEFYKLIQFVNREIADSRQNVLLMVIPPKISGKHKDIIMNQSGLVSAQIKVLGAYFPSREVITFTEDGTISFGSWLDLKNIKIIALAFSKWCRYLVLEKSQQEGIKYESHN